MLIGIAQYLAGYRGLGSVGLAVPNPATPTERRRAGIQGLVGLLIVVVVLAALELVCFALLVAGLAVAGYAVGGVVVAWSVGLTAGGVAGLYLVNVYSLSEGQDDDG